MNTQEIQVGSKVRVNAGTGLVRWVGTDPAFAAGKWIGIELCVSYFNLPPTYTPG